MKFNVTPLGSHLEFYIFAKYYEMYKVIVKNKKSPTSFGRNGKMKTVKNILKPF